MEKLDLGSHQISYSSQLADLYKNLKKNQKLTSTQKVIVYINEKGNLAIFENKKEAKLNRYKKLENKVLYKQIKLEQNTIDHKIARTAVKALLFLHWKKPFDLKAIVTDFPILKNAISPKRSKEIESMLPNLKAIKRSEEGGNGVIFFEFKENESLPNLTNFVIKFVEEARSVLCADRLLQAMGFVTPKSCFIHDSSPLKKQLIASTLDHIEHINIDNHTQVKKQTAGMRCILIMNTLTEAVSLRQLRGAELLRLFNEANTLIQFGKMIFIDLLMNNTDRLNVNACNLGNMLLDYNGILHLLDHEMKISAGTLTAVKTDLKLLLDGKMTNQIIINLEGALKFDRKKMGPITLSEELKQKMKKNLDEGIRQAAVQICHLVDSPAAYNHIFQPYLEESEKIDSKSFLEVVQYVYKLIK
ncbi:MAG: hypothetical protein LLG04_04090 [Parachlamydia sp.]|nr:hypothetical protein [Parachlamydia sp.]